MFFHDWFGLGRVVIVAAIAYAALILMLRISGSRTLAKMNAFDLVVTIALGSILATTLLSKDTPLIEGLLAFGMLIALQWLVAWLSVRSRTWRGLVKSEPMLLALHGKFVRDGMIQARITEEEVHAALRCAGHASLAAVAAVVMETDGSISVIRGGETQTHSALQVIKGYRAREPAEGSRK